MATEQYSIGYEEGHQAGWNAAMESLPAQRTWVGLTDEEFYAVIRPFYGTDESCHAAMRISLDEFKAIEAKLKEKNT